MSITKEQIYDFHQALLKQSVELKRINDFGHSRRATTTKIIRSISALLLILMGVNLFFMFQLNTHLMNMVKEIDVMKSSFILVSDDMGSINNDIKDISLTMTLMPDVSLSMQQINQDMPSISSSMMQITGNMGSVKSKLKNINTTMHSVNNKMGYISESSQRIQTDMGQIAHPTKYFNWMMPN